MELQGGVFKSGEGKDFLKIGSYFAGYKQDNRIFAELEYDRLTPYFDQFHQQLMEDVSAMGLSEDILSAPLQKNELLKNTFNAIAARTRNTILSGFSIIPFSKMSNFGDRSMQSFFKRTLHRDFYIGFGFVQVYETEQSLEDKSLKPLSSTSASLIGLDDDIIRILTRFDTDDLLKALQYGAQSANHDMQHHLTSEAINNTISNTFGKEQPKDIDEMKMVHKWMANFSGNGDENIFSYESFLILNHARVWERMLGKVQEKALIKNTEKYFDALAGLSEQMQSSSDSISTSEVIDYMGMMYAYTLVRFLPLNHPLIDYTFSRLKDIDPLSEVDLNEEIKNTFSGEALQKHFNFRERKNYKSNYLARTVKNYRAAGMEMGKTYITRSKDYIALKKYQLASISPEIAYLNSPSKNDFHLQQAKDEAIQHNVTMMQAVAFDSGLFKAGVPIDIEREGRYKIRALYDEGGNYHSYDDQPIVIDDVFGKNERWFEHGVKHRIGKPASILTYKDSEVVKRTEYFLRGEQHNDKGPAVISRYANGNVSQLSYKIKGKYHRTDGPAYVFNYEDGSTKIVKYFHDDIIHREDGPAIIAYYDDGSLQIEEYFQNGHSHRTDGPAYTSYNKDGVIKYEYYHIEGVRHREDGPAEITRYEDGSTKLEVYYRDGQMHNENGPAKIRCFKGGPVACEDYILNNKYHRQDGPARIKYLEDGQVEDAKFYIDDNWLGTLKCEDATLRMAWGTDNAEIPQDQIEMVQRYIDEICANNSELKLIDVQASWNAFQKEIAEKQRAHEERRQEMPSVKKDNVDTFSDKKPKEKSFKRQF